jgi:hypothetical protein
MRDRLSHAVIYAGLVGVSLVTVPVLLGFSLAGGFALAVGGAIAGALVRPGRTRDRAVVAVRSGLALLVGPALYVLVAITSR